MEQQVKGSLTPHDILEKWAQYTHYDPEQTTFRLLGNDYRLHSCNKLIDRFLAYDPSGILSVLYAKRTMMDILMQKQVKAYDVVSNPDMLKYDCEMWRLFCSDDVIRLQRTLLDQIDDMVTKLARNKAIGERDLNAEQEALLESATAVVSELDSCKLDVFSTSGNPLQPITRYSTHIHVFDLLSDCLMALEQANDGMYLCYIDNHGTADGYFGFFIKGQGNILSVNERVDETFPGQHKRSRNGRWAESKKFDLFPYKYIFEYGQYDYKGYAGKHMIDKEQLAFFQLTPAVYMPLVFAMILINNKLTGQTFQQDEVKFVDALLPVNVARALEDRSEALAVIQNSGIVAVNRTLNIELDSTNVRSGTFAKRFEDEQRTYRERGEFPSRNPILVELYGDGFELDTEKLLLANQHLLALPGPDEKEEDTDRTPNFQFVGTAGAFEVVAYKNAREQLAEYIRDRMLEEYLAAGGKDGIRSWYNDIIKRNRDQLFRMCMQKEQAVQAGTEKNPPPGWTDATDNPLRFITIQETSRGSAEGINWTQQWAYPFNEPTALTQDGECSGKWLCPITGNKASLFFVFQFGSWLDMEKVFKGSLIKPVIGWRRVRIPVGNHILAATDACSAIGTVFERDEIRRNKRLWTRDEWRQRINWSAGEAQIPKNTLSESPAMDFSFAIGFSKRGWNRFCKDISRDGQDLPEK